MGAAGSTNSFQWNNAGAFAGGATGRLRKVDTNNVTNNNGLADDTNVFFGENVAQTLTLTTGTTMFGNRVAQQFGGGDNFSFFGSNICTEIDNSGGGNASSIFGSDYCFQHITNSLISAFGYKVGYTDTTASITDPATEICVFGSSSLQYQSGVPYDFQLSNECIFGHGVRTEIVDTEGGGYNNVFLGAHIFLTNDSPDRIVVVGYRACYFTNGTDFTSGFNTSTVIGAKAMSDSTPAVATHITRPITIIGHEAGYGNVATRNSTFIGYQAGYKFKRTDIQQENTRSNTFIGNQIVANVSGYGGFEGQYNTIIGYRAAYNSEPFANNTAIGYHALLNIASGSISLNTVIGSSAGGSITTGQEYNVLIGTSSNTTGIGNVVIGSTASSSNNYNVVLGQGANSSGTRNVVFGRNVASSGDRNVIFANSSGNRNVLLGASSFNNDVDSVVLGYGTNQTALGGYTVVIGRGCLNGLIGGNDSNVILGASIFNTGQIGRTVSIGYGAGVSSITGGTTTASQCVFIGYLTRPRTGSAPAAETQTPANEICLGNSSITNIYAQVTSITALSDARDKKNINSFPLGLEFIKKLNPVTFTWNMRDGGIKDIDSCGFIAQDVAEALNECNVDDLGIVHGEGGEQMQLTEWKIFYAVVQGIKELSERNKMMREKLNLAGL